MVFMGLVGVFFLCHILRVALNIHEMLVIQHAMECFEAGMQGFPLWSLVLGKIRSVFTVQRKLVTLTPSGMAKKSHS